MGSYALRPPAGHVAVIYVPGVGGRTNVVRDWQLPGSGRRVSAAVWNNPANPGPVVDRGQQLVAALERAGITDATLVGHSLGALIAFEAAAHHAPAIRRLVLVAQYPPHLMRRYTPQDLEDEHVLDQLTASVPPELRQSAEFIDLMRSVWAEEYRRLAEYQPTGMARVPIQVIGASADKWSGDESRLRQWDRYTSGQMDARVVSGGHNFVENLTAGELETLIREALSDR